MKIYSYQAARYTKKVITLYASDPQLLSNFIEPRQSATDLFIITNKLEIKIPNNGIPLVEQK